MTFYRTPGPGKLQRKISRVYLGFIAGLMGVVLATVSIVLVVELRSSMKTSLRNKAFHVTERMELRLEHLRENIKNFSQNHLIINSIVHPLERGIYLPKMVDDFSRLENIDTVSVLDYTGKPIYSSHPEPPNYRKIFYLQPVLEDGESIIRLSGDKTQVLVIEPIRHHEAPIGAVIAEIDLNGLINRILPKDISEFHKLYTRNTLLISHNYQVDSDYILINNPVEKAELPILYSLDLWLEMGKLQSVHLKPVFMVIVQLVIIGIAFLLMAAVIASRVGNSLARPILTMVDKTEQADGGAVVRFSPLGTGDELEILAQALDNRDAELTTYRENLEEEVKKRTLKLSELNTRLEQEGEERERALLLLDKSEARIRGIVDNLLDGIITIDETGRIDTFNPAAEKIFGYAKSEVVGRNIMMLMPERYHEKHVKSMDQYLETGVLSAVGASREVSGKRKDGSVFPMDISVNAVKGKDYRMFAGIIRDITERKQAEQLLVDAKEKAEEANRLKSEFLNVMSHELRTPLTVMMGNLSLLTDPDDLPDAEETLDIATDIEGAGEHLLQLINDLLDISKIEAGKMELKKENVSVRELVADCLFTIQSLAAQKGLELKDAVTDMAVRADPLRIKQVLLNLLSNAVKFTDQGSISVTVEPAGDQAVFTVSDTGCGIEKEKVGQVFEKFTQVDGSARRAAGGTGLGLAITKKLVELHNGTIHADSEPGKGSLFRFFLPLETENGNDGSAKISG